MIQRKADNQTLYRILPDGSEESYGPLDGDKFFILDQILDAQLAAAQANKFAQDDYLQKLHNAQIAIDSGRVSNPIVIAPLFKSVDDFGVESNTLWNPPLPGLKFPVITKSTPSAVPVDPNNPIVDNTILLAWLKRIYAVVSQPISSTNTKQQ